MKVFILAVLCLFIGSGRSQLPDCFGEGPPTKISTQSLSSGADTFGLNIFRNIATKYSKHSIIISPFSVWAVLKLAYLGANGNTKNELQNALGIASTAEAFYGGNIIDSRLRSDKGTTFNKADIAYFANDMNIRQCVLSRLPTVKRVDFTKPEEAANKINGDVSKATEGKINKFMSPSVVRNARFILINAVYFKGNWTFPFPKEATAKKPFMDETGNTLSETATMMTAQGKFNYAESQVLGASVVELPYEDSNIAMYVILPDEGTSTANSVISKLNSDSLAQVEADLKPNMVVMSLPRFKMTTRIATELKEALQAEGIFDLFQVGKSDLSNFIEGEPAVVDDSLHHATIEVTEEGTVAAAVTALIGTRSGAQVIKIFNANRPFIFLIRDVSQGITLFTGVLRNPNHTTPF